MNTEIMQAYASCPKYIELLLKDEMLNLGASSASEKLAGVNFEATSETLMRVLLWSRLANRIYVLLNSIKISNSDDLYNAISHIKWNEQLNKVPQTLSVSFKGTNKELRNTQYSSQVVKDAICDQLRDITGTRPDFVKSQADLSVSVVLKHNQALIYLDISGRSLHLRGYRKSLTAAPLKENLASAILTRADWQNLSKNNYNLIDPMCGSGTLLTEGYLMACDIAPGLTHPKYSVFSWIHFDQNLWDSLIEEAKTRMLIGIENYKGQIIGADHHKDSIEIANEHAYQLNAENKIDCQLKTLDSFNIPPKNNLIVCNPPYGVRLKKNVDSSWKNLAQWLADKALEAKAAIITHNKNQGFILGFRAEKSWKFKNGELDINLIAFNINQDKKLNVPDGQNFALPETAQMVANRIKKNQSKLSKWLKKENINAYRVYDADIPEYAVAVDVYNNHINIQEYKAPASVPESKARKRLDEAIMAAQSVLKIKNENTHVKSRFRQVDNQQYEKKNSNAHNFKIVENGRKYLVNLEQYLDTGIFLDHRWVRDYIHANCKDKTLLNLFSYTGSVTVAAALGGAEKSVSVDTSNAYLQWTKENFKINHIDLLKHKLVKSDVLEYIFSCKETFDIIFVDPPTYSNSHSRKEDWDVQRDHVKLLLACKKLLNAGGEIIFSNNYRKFKLDESLNEQFAISDWTKRSTSPDFEKSKIKRVCYQLKSL